MKARNWIVAGVSAGVLAGGVAGFMVAVPGGAGAAVSNTVQVADSETNEASIAPQHHGQPHLTPEQRAAKFEEVLQSLVTAGTLDAAELDAVITALTTRPTTPPTGERPDPVTIITTRLQGLVDNGTITVAQRDAVIATLQAARPDNDGDGQHGDHDGPRGPRAEQRAAALATAAQVIGVTADELKTALQNGDSIADVATANGVDPQDVIDALVAQATNEITERITDMVNGVRPADAPADPAN